MKSILKISLLAFALTIATPSSGANELGRLFFTPQQRAQLESGQHLDIDNPENGKLENDKPEITDSLTVSGIVQKHGGERTVWINGVPQLIGKSDEHAPESVPVAIPGQSQPVRVKVGQKVQINQPTPQKTDQPNMSESDD